MATEIVRIKRENISKLDPKSFLDIDKIEKGLMKDTIVYVAFEEGEPAGIVTLEPVGSVYRTSYFFVSEKYRHKGVGRKMMEAVKSYDPKIFINDSMQGYETMISAFEHMGVRMVKEVNFYGFDRNEETMASCMNMMKEKGLDLMEMLHRHGYVAQRIKMTSQEVIEKLGEEIGHGFDEDNNPFIIKHLDTSWSHIVTKDGFPAAFIACVVEDDTLRIEQLCAHRSFKRRGASMMALFSVMERILVDPEISRVVTGVVSKNEEMTHIIIDKLGVLLTEAGQSKVYALV
jgi:GNAT superfamily N-acetyltransferase